jgi:hypothetical protein
MQAICSPWPQSLGVRGVERQARVVRRGRGFPEIEPRGVTGVRVEGTATLPNGVGRHPSAGLLPEDPVSLPGPDPQRSPHVLWSPGATEIGLSLACDALPVLATSTIMIAIDARSYHPQPPSLSLRESTGAPQRAEAAVNRFTRRRMEGGEAAARGAQQKIGSEPHGAGSPGRRFVN